MSCQFTAWPTAACHVVKATGCDIEFGAADRTRKRRVSSYPLQDLVAPLFVPERRTNIPWRRSQTISTVELEGLLRRAVPLGARWRCLGCSGRDTSTCLRIACNAQNGAADASNGLTPSVAARCSSALLYVGLHLGFRVGPGNNLLFGPIGIHSEPPGDALLTLKRL